MEREEFEKYWDVSREELADICCCSLNTVNHWYSRKSHRKPRDEHECLLALAHHLWTAIETEIETEPEYLKRLREMYHQKPRRRHSRM